MNSLPDWLFWVMNWLRLSGSAGLCERSVETLIWFWIWPGPSTAEARGSSSSRRGP